MSYNYYSKLIENTDNRRKLERILRLIENDFEGISGRQYECLRFLILSKIYA